MAMAVVVGVSAGGTAQAQGVSFGPNDVQSVFHVSKSQNRNQVHYALRLDQQCRPVGKAPVYGYWKKLEKRGRSKGRIRRLAILPSDIW